MFLAVYGRTRKRKYYHLLSLEIELVSLSPDEDFLVFTMEDSRVSISSFSKRRDI